MPRDYNFYYNLEGGSKRSAFGANSAYKTRNTLNSNMYNNQDMGGMISTDNLKKVASVGLLFNVGQKANEIVGARTENRLRQRKINTGMTFAKYGVGLSISPVVGSVYAVGDVGYRLYMYNIKLQKQNREANYYKRLSGNNALSGSRYRSDYV